MRPPEVSSTEPNVMILAEALSLVKKIHPAKFDETVEMAVRLGVDPRHADQMVRGSVVMPHGIGKVARVLVFAKGEKEKEALGGRCGSCGG